MQIDYILPYVKPTENWTKSLKYFSEKKSPESTRWRDFNLIEFLRPSIEKYAPWINSVKLIVASEDQVPEYLRDWTKLDVILHSEFIPQEYLPTFNSSAIEMFLPFLPRTSEYFIYGNDDFLFWNPCKESDFFTTSKKEKKPILALKRYEFFPNYKSGEFMEVCLKDTKLVYGHFFDIKTYPGPIIPKHGRANPGRLSYYKEAYNLFEEQIKNSLTAFRNNSKNYNQYIYSLYMDAKKLSVDEGFPGYYVDIDLDNLKNLEGSDSPMICINDNEKTTEAFWKEAKSIVAKKLSL